ncbi:hypothetical protein [Hydrogenophaga soli]
MKMSLKSVLYRVLVMVVFSIGAPGSVFAYSYTIKNVGGAPIYWAHAHTVSSLCHDVGIDMPQPNGLLPGMSVSFSTSSICLVDSISFNVNKAGGQWDFSSPYVVQAVEVVDENVVKIAQAAHAACFASCPTSLPRLDNKVCLDNCNHEYDISTDLEISVRTKNHQVCFENCSILKACLDDCNRAYDETPGKTINHTSPPIYPPNWSSSIGMASGTFVVTPGRTCFTSGFIEGLDKVGVAFENAILEKSNMAGVANIMLNQLISAVSPEISLAMTVQSAAFFALSGVSGVYDMGVSTPNNPFAVQKFIPMDAAVPMKIRDILHGSVGCGW